jgi:hypothetical protein
MNLDYPDQDPVAASGTSQDRRMLVVALAVSLFLVLLVCLFVPSDIQ